MRLLSKSNYRCFTYKINMEELISSVYHLIVDIFIEKRNNQPFNECVSELFSVDKIYETKQSIDSLTKDSFLFDVVSFLEEGLYSTFDYFNRTKAYLLYREKNLIIIKGVDKSSDVQKIVANWIKKYNPIERIFDVVKDPNLQKHKERLCSLLTNANYNRVVKIEHTKILESTLIPKGWINIDSFRISPIDNSSMWIDKQFTSIVGEISEINLNELALCNGEIVGLMLEGYILPLINIDDYIIKDNAVNYFWSMLKNTYAPNKGAINTLNKKQLEPFIEKGKDSELCKLLSYLQYNLYIKSSEKIIPPQFTHLFEEVYSISELEHLSNFCFYTGIPNPANNQTLLGVYEYEKTSSEYNLLNWVHASENANHRITRCNNCIEKKSQKVYALLPQYSYYFMSKYFEDNFADILEELRCEYITDVNLSRTSDVQNNFIQIDALVKKDDRIIYFENKTTLNKLNIDETIGKIENFHSFISKAYPYLKFEYIIISPYCDETIKNSYWYFAKDGYTAREDIKHYAYDFVIPLAKFDNVSLRCIVEPEYEKMKALINSIIR